MADEERRDTPGEHFVRAANRASMHEEAERGWPLLRRRVRMNYDGNERRSGQDRREGGIRFDKTINLGHVLTMATMIAAVMGSWSLMDKRVVVLEVSKEAQKERDTNQDQASREKFTEVRERLTELRDTVNKVADRVGAK